MSECFVVKNCFLEEKRIETISQQPAREVLMLLWAFLVMETSRNNGDSLVIDETNIVLPETLAHTTKIPLEIIKLGLSLFIQMGMVEQRKIGQQPQNDGFKKVRASVSGTPLDKLTDTELETLEGKHGKERLETVCEIVAETWKKTKKDIHNPGGYINTLCGSLKIPSWYALKNEPKAESQSKLHSFWEALPEQDKKNYLQKAKTSIPASIIKDAPADMLEAVAQQIAWNEHLFDWVREQV